MKWLQRWRSFEPDPEIMRRSSPKYVPREWMLVEAVWTFYHVSSSFFTHDDYDAKMPYYASKHGSANAKLRLLQLCSVRMDMECVHLTMS